MKTIKERRLEILNWEKDNRNINNRSVKSDGAVGCAYAGPIGCGVGRLIDDKKLCAELDRRLDSSVASNSLFNLLPKEVQDLGQIFLTDLQRLHDGIRFWIEKGLSSEGLIRYDAILGRINDCEPITDKLSAFDAGNASYYNGIARDANPYDEDMEADAFEEWEDGWDQGDSDCDCDDDDVFDRKWEEDYE
jgi:hypothetical protein